MKKLLFLILFLPLFSLSQVPQGVGYQGVATDANGIELVNQLISIRASILSASPTGTIEWQETHNTSTDTFGLFTLTIGQGTSTGNGAQSNFADITWGANSHFLKIEMDVNGGTNYSHVGTNQMMSVPYALYAENTNINYDSIATILSNDSTFITTFSGVIGGGYDWKFPEGFDGEIIFHDLQDSSYTVPAGKRLYILSVYGGYNPKVDGRYVSIANNNMNGKPYIAYSGQVISMEYLLMDNVMNGILVNETNNIIPVFHDLQDSSYTVPAGKRLYILSVYGGHNPKIDGRYVNIANSNMSGKPYIAYSGQVISMEYFSMDNVMNGYLVDENYFANSWGGGNNSQRNFIGNGITISDDICIDVDNVINININDPILNDVSYINCLESDTLSNIYVAIYLGSLTDQSEIKKYDDNLNLIWTKTLSGNIKKLLFHGGSLFISGKQVANQYNQREDFVSCLDLNNGNTIWHNDLNEGKGSGGDLLQANDTLVFYFNHDYIHNGNNGQYYFTFDRNTGSYTTYSHNTPFPKEFKLHNNIAYVGGANQNGAFAHTYDFSQGGGQTSGTNNNFTFYYSSQSGYGNFIFSSGQMVSHYFYQYTPQHSYESKFNIGLFGNLQNTIYPGSNPLNNPYVDLLKPNNNGFSHFLTITNPSVNYLGQALFEKLSDPYGYFLLDVDMNYNLLSAKSFSSLCYDSYDSFRFEDLNSGKKAVAIKTKIDGGNLSIRNQICIDGQDYSGHILLIY